MSGEDKSNQLKNSMKEEYDKRNYQKVIEIADKILLENPNDVFTIEMKLDALMQIINQAPEEKKEEMHRQYSEIARNAIKILEEVYNVHSHDANKDHIKFYQKAQNNIAWYLNLDGKSNADWELGLKLVEKALNKGSKEYILDTKVRLLLKLGRKDAAYSIVFDMLKANPNAGDVQDLKFSQEYRNWLLKDLNLDEKEKNFIQEIENATKQKIQIFDKEEQNAFGIILREGHIISLRFYYLYELKTIPSSIVNLSHLEKLTFVYCSSLTAISDSIGNLKNLKELTIDGCHQLSTLPENIGNLEKLKKLSISNNYTLGSLPQSIGNLSSLESFVLEGSDALKTLPDSFCNLKNLKEITIRSYYGFEALPKNLGNLQSLQKLELVHSQEIREIPESIGKLNKLIELKLDNCYVIEKLPDSIGTLSSLQKLSLLSCRDLKSLPKTISNLKNLKELEIEDCDQIKELPENIGNLENLQKLILKKFSREFKKIPKSFGNLRNLTDLTINSCLSLEEIPDSIGNLRSLQKFDLNSNDTLNTLPKSIGNLDSLQNILINSCSKLKELPDSISNLKQLKELSIVNCIQIKKLPENITKLKQLKILDLQNCQKLEISPTSLINFQSIEKITIINCSLTELPEKLISAKKITINLSNNIYTPKISERMNLISKRWKKSYEPWRSLILWGWDDRKNPCFLILYGKHKFMGVKIDIQPGDIEEYFRINADKYINGYKPQIQEGIHDILQDFVIYNCNLMIRGKGTHLPAFKRVKIIQMGHYNYETRTRTYDEPSMFYKKGLKYRYGWRAKDEYKAKDFKNLEKNKQISLPYFSSISYENIIKELKSRGIRFDGFNYANNPNEILKINQTYSEYFELLVKILTHHDIYMRKKFLNTLISKNPPKEIYKKILEVGSSELIAGLFLEFAKNGNPILKTEAEQILSDDISWVEYNYAQGIKRCTKIYYNTLNPSLKEERIKWIKNNHFKIDLHINAVRGKELPPDKVISGATYRKYSKIGVFRDYQSYYDYDTRQYVSKSVPKRYEIGPYTDGVRLNQIEFKNTIQEAEIYGLADILGKIAYYIDAPRLLYYLTGSEQRGAYNYFQRYLKRLFNSFAENEENKFMEAMKNMLTSYTSNDYVCKYPGCFQFNKFLQYYLYHDVPIKRIVKRYYDERDEDEEMDENEEMDEDDEREKIDENDELESNDPLMKEKGRHEYKKDVWDRHLDVVADIAIGAQIEQVSKACYYILNESHNSSEFINRIDYNRLIGLALVSYKPLSKMFSSILLNKIEALEQFDPELMLSLMGCQDVELQTKGMDYFKKTNGKFNPQTLVSLLFLKNIDQWIELLQINLLNLTGEQFAEFIANIINNLHNFLEKQINLSEGISNILTASTAKVKEISKIKRAEIFTVISNTLFNESKFPEWLATFIEELIFSIPYEDLELTVEGMQLESAIRSSTSRNNRILSILKAIKYKRLSSDSEIINILEFATSKMINVFLTVIEKNKEELKKRFTTLLLMFESDITALNLYAELIFNSISETDQKKLHSIVIDSPVKRAYSFGLRKLDEKYKDYIPSEFIVQMLEHGAPEVKAYISDKINKIINDLGKSNKDLFMYFVKTLLLLPNKYSKAKDKLYGVLPRFALLNKDKLSEVENILIDIGGSNVIIDSERALTTLAKIKKEVELNASNL